MDQKYADYAVEKAVELLGIDSPTGFTEKAAEWVLDAFRSLGYEAVRTIKGGVLVDLGGENTEEGALLLQAHTDTLGAMVAEVKGNGRLRVTNLGGMRAENGETENGAQSRRYRPPQCPAHAYPGRLSHPRPAPLRWC